MLYRVHLAWAEFELTTLMVIGTDCIGSYKSNFHYYIVICVLSGYITILQIILLQKNMF